MPYNKMVLPIQMVLHVYNFMSSSTIGNTGPENDYKFQYYAITA